MGGQWKRWDFAEELEWLLCHSAPSTRTTRPYPLLIAALREVLDLQKRLARYEGKIMPEEAPHPNEVQYQQRHDIGAAVQNAGIDGSRLKKWLPVIKEILDLLEKYGPLIAGSSP